MKILREYLGGSEVIDLSTDDGWHEFAYMVVQDDETAEELRAEIERDGWAVVNESEPEFLERYTRLEGA
jgi:hypothetical protein